MTILAFLEDSPRRGKRFRVTLINDKDRRLLKIIDFSSSEHENYLIHGDKKRRERYWKRHSGMSKERMHDPLTAAFWAANLAWTKPTIEEAKKYISNNYDVVFIP
jgi:hypothetical protein